MELREKIINDLKNSGLKSSDRVLIHSSLKQIGNIDANEVLDILIDYFKDGLLLFPTHTWGYIKNDGDAYDVIKSKPNVGILPTLFLERKGVVRSLHPTHSMAGLGRLAETYLKGEENMNTPCNPLGVYGRLYDIDAKILLIGVNQVKNTYIHSVEESFNVQNRISAEETLFNIITKDNDKLDVLMHKHYCSLHPHVSECYQKLDPIFLEEGAMKIKEFGNAEMRICEARKIYDILSKIFSHELQILVEKNEIPVTYYRGA